MRIIIAATQRPTKGAMRRTVRIARPVAGVRSDGPSLIVGFRESSGLDFWRKCSLGSKPAADHHNSCLAPAISEDRVLEAEDEAGGEFHEELDLDPEEAEGKGEWKGNQRDDDSDDRGELTGKMKGGGGKD